MFKGGEGARLNADGLSACSRISRRIAALLTAYTTVRPTASLSPAASYLMKGAPLKQGILEPRTPTVRAMETKLTRTRKGAT